MWSLFFYLTNRIFFLVLVRLHRIVPRRNYSRNGSSPREWRGDTSTPATAAAAEPRTSASTTQQLSIRGYDKSESKSKSAEIAALARFWQTERR